MKRKRVLTIPIVTGLLAFVGVSAAISAQDKYTVKVPNGLSFSEFKGIRVPGRLSPISQNGEPYCRDPSKSGKMIKAYSSAGVPGNGKPFPRRLPSSRRSIWNPKKDGDVPRSERCQVPSMTSTS